MIVLALLALPVWGAVVAVNPTLGFTGGGLHLLGIFIWATQQHSR